jgi:NAD(P) transhydrogenase
LSLRSGETLTGDAVLAAAGRKSNELLFRRDDLKLLGVHAIGEQATELVHVGLKALLTGSGAGVFDEACFNIPALGSLYKIAALDAMQVTIKNLNLA